MSTEPRRRWRDYRTAAGRRPVKEFIDGLSDIDAAAVVAAMRDVRDTGLATARHLRGDVYEERADGDRQTYWILFAPEGRRSQFLLALESFSKKTQKTPPRRFLDEIVDERRERNPKFPDLVEAALRRRQLLRELAARREKLGLSQTLVAARMGTSQSAIARLEAGEIDAKLSTVERFAAALGQKVEWRVARAR